MPNSFIENVNTVASGMAELAIAAENIEAIVGAKEQADIATQKASEAASSASEIKNLTVSVSTVSPSAPASSSYDPATGELVLNIPKGDIGSQGIQGDDGLSAYQIALNGGFVGTEAEWIASLKGEQGLQGEKGADGTMTFADLTPEQIALLKGEQGLQGVAGADGADGLSAYQVALNNGFVGTEVEWIASLKGEQGLQGVAGADGADGSSDSTFSKPFIGAPLFTKVSAASISIPVDTSVKVGAATITVSGSAYVLSLNTSGVGGLDTGAKAAGTDYYVYALEVGGFIISANATNPSGYTTANSKKIGGFHYSLVPENFTAINNISSTKATMLAGIFSLSFWDLKWKPKNKGNDARGMYNWGDRWYDIYLLNTDHHLHGTSAAGKTIAGGAISNGRNFPKIPLEFGGDGTVTYGTLTWFEASEIGRAYGKELLSYAEFAAEAYGVLEASSASTADTGITQHLANYTGHHGMCMATGCQWIWGKDLIGPVGAAWNTNTEGRGSIYNASLVAALFGGARDDSSNSGSRASLWFNYVWSSNWSVGCRFACDHLELA